MNGLFSPMLAAMRKRAVAPLLQGRVLDFGCGIGRLCDLVAPDAFVGVDADSKVLAVAHREHPRHVFQNLDRLPQLGGFDTIVAMAVIGYVDDLPNLLSGLSAKLNPGGKIIMTSPVPEAILLHKFGARLGLFGSDVYETVSRLPRRSGIEAAAKGAGLRVTSFGRFMFGLNQLAVIAR